MEEAQKDEREEDTVLEGVAERAGVGGWKKKGKANTARERDRSAVRKVGGRVRERDKKRRRRGVGRGG